MPKTEVDKQVSLKGQIVSIWVLEGIWFLSQVLNSAIGVRK